MQGTRTITHFDQFFSLSPFSTVHFYLSEALLLKYWRQLVNIWHIDREQLEKHSCTLVTLHFSVSEGRKLYKAVTQTRLWRKVLCEDFTLENLIKEAWAIELSEKKPPKSNTRTQMRCHDTQWKAVDEHRTKHKDTMSKNKDPEHMNQKRNVAIVD